MAWISVHEQVLGGKLRELAKAIGCSQNEALGIVVRFWLWCINNADKNGLIIGAEVDDLVEAMSIGKSNEISAERMVGAMIDTGWVDVSKKGIFVHDWEEWQASKYKCLEIEERNRTRQRLFRERQKTDEVKPEEEVKKPEPKKKPQDPKPKYTEGFEEFWKIYPRKVGKGEAYKKFQARVNDGFKPEELIEAAKNYASHCSRERTEEKYIKQGKTFLSETLPFEDYLTKSKQPQQEQLPQDGSNPFGEYLSGS